MRVMRPLVGAVLAVVLLADSAIAGALEDGVAAYVRQDYPTALRLLRPLAEHGVAEAQGRLGYMYFMGKGVAQDYAEAAHWYRMAADRGVADAQVNLGIMYARGQGVAQDDVEAAR